LFRDYRAEYVWFEIPKIFCTLCLCGLVSVVTADPNLRILFAMGIAGCLALSLAELNPHLGRYDDRMSQYCQVTLTFVLGVGLYYKTDRSTPGEMLGVLLVVSVAGCWVAGLGGIVRDLWTTFFHAKSKKMARMLLGRRRLSAQVGENTVR
jgi:hypothetical protein